MAEGGFLWRRVTRILLLVTAFSLTAAYANTQPVHAALHEARQSQPQGKARWDELHSIYLANLRNSLEPNGHCTWDNMVVRREWGDMSKQARLDYLSALHCLKNRPGMTSHSAFPGARGRWDDLAVAHLINVQSIHRSPWLSVWHRHYTWRLELALREECGYEGGLPYWHWSKYLDQDVNTWPLFDGSETSISGNGTQTGPECACVANGPMASWTINLGPQGQDTWGCKRNPRADGLGYNPACIERTFNTRYLNSLRWDEVVYTIDEAHDANRFAQLIELESPSVHNAPHLFIGGTQLDVTFSSQDPWFFFHHCMVDFLFSVWQSLDWNVRTTSLPGSHIFDQIRSQGGWSLPTPEVDLKSIIHLSPVFANITVEQAMWPTKNYYCYRYE
ncbi:hypothetical protein AC579_8562 [Pseudocercospora musae]|uniref:Tyrosinase copper-binding domain-containing protein n=1 Tax=Pseudocercospora musae TaxID=113226 RepID=A0A139H5V8_9PEZI|nr:hypothetical protein AC579_8562 [Pseudocercospora musae]KXS97836.1 hypothetical protein AC579_8562 [Pseudocercospora musae]KXS97837.1 hypothetical protein AC579_8562 [Pseudocercospora musae]